MPAPGCPQIKGTVLLMPSGSDRITSAPLQQLQSDKSVADEEVKALLATRWGARVWGGLELHVHALGAVAGRSLQHALALPRSNRSAQPSPPAPSPGALRPDVLRLLAPAACSLKNKKKKKKAAKEGAEA